MVYLKKILHSLYDFSNSFDYIDTTIEGERYSEEFVLGAKTYNSQIEICCSFSTLIFTLEGLLHSTEYRVPPEQQYTCCCTSSSSTLAAVPQAVVHWRLGFTGYPATGLYPRFHTGFILNPDNK